MDGRMINVHKLSDMLCGVLYIVFQVQCCIVDFHGNVELDMIMKYEMV